jgi:hypothetical protein
MKKKTRESIPPEEEEQINKMYHISSKKKPKDPPKPKRINKTNKKIKVMKIPKNQTSRINANIQKDLHIRIKIEAAKRGKTIGSIIEDWIRKHTKDISQ